MSSVNDGYTAVSATAAADPTTARHFLVTIEKHEARRRGVREREARPFVARRLKAAPGTLENLRRLRNKMVPSWLMERIRAEFVAVLQAEKARLQHEIDLATQIGVGHRDELLAKASAHLETVKALLGER